MFAAYKLRCGCKLLVENGADVLTILDVLEMDDGIELPHWRVSSPKLYSYLTQCVQERYTLNTCFKRAQVENDD